MRGESWIPEQNYFPLIPPDWCLPFPVHLNSELAVQPAKEPVLEMLPLQEQLA